MVTWLTHRQVVAWRLEQHFLEPIGKPAVEDVVDRLCGVQSQVASSAELAIRMRRQGSIGGEVGEAIADGRLLKTWAMRGALHLVTPDLGSALLAVMAAGRAWERPSWQRYFGLTTEVMERLREASREILEGRTLTREELGAEITARPGLEHLGEQLRSGWGTVLKPLAWQGDICFGPSRGTRVTFMRPEAASSAWRGLPALDLAAPRVVAAYLGAYGPASIDRFGGWLAGGWFGKRQLRAWFDALDADLAEVLVDGEPAFARASDVDALVAASPSTAVRLLPGFDQWVLGPGSGDSRLVASHRRSAVSRTGGWISPVVTVGGVVCGTWEVAGDAVSVTWFAEAGPVPRRRLDAEAGRLSALLAQPKKLVVTLS